MLKRGLLAAAVGLACFAPLWAQVPGQVPASVAGAKPQTEAGTAPGALVPAQSYTEFALGKWDELQAESAGGEKYIQGALAHYHAALAAAPDSAYIAAQLADLLSRLNHTDAAVQLVEKTIAAHPDSIVAHKVLAEIYLRQLSNAPQPLSDATTGGAMSAAVREYQTLMRLAPANADYVVMLGKLYGAEGKAADAEREFRAALAISPTDTDAVASLVQSLASQNRLDEAKAEIDALPEVARGAQVYATLGDAYSSRHRYSEAAQAYGEALAAAPDNAALLKAQAGALMDGGEYAAALAAYTKLRSQQPEDGNVALRLGQLQMQMGQLDAARSSLGAAAKLLGPGNIEVSYATALLDQTQGKDEIARKELETLAGRKNSPATQSIFLTQLARLDMRMGRYAEAQTQLSALQGLGTAYQAQAQRLQIALYSDQHNYPKALAATKTALAQQPDSRSLQVTYANLLAASGKPGEARAALEPLLSGSAKDWDLYLALGQVDLTARDWKQALADTGKAEKLASTPNQQVRALTQRGDIEVQQRAFGSAEKSYRQALQLEPEAADTLNALGYLLAEEGVRLPEALGYVQQALSQDGQNGSYLDSLGWIYFKMKRMPEAVNSLEQAARLERHDPDILDHLAQAYEGDGKLQQAASSWTRALEDLKLHPGADRRSQEIQKKLEAVRVRIAEAGKQ